MNSAFYRLKFLLVAIIATGFMTSSLNADEQAERRERIQQLVRESSELLKAGRHEEARRLQNEIRELLRIPRSESAVENHPDGQHEREIMRRRMSEHPTPEPPPHPELKKIRHLLEAAENLAAGGFEDEAHQLRDRAQMMEREFHERHQHPSHSEQMRDELHKLQESLIKEIRELHVTVHQLKREIDALKREVVELRQRPPQNAPPAARRPPTERTQPEPERRSRFRAVEEKLKPDSPPHQKRGEKVAPQKENE